MRVVKGQVKRREVPRVSIRANIVNRKYAHIVHTCSYTLGGVDVLQ